MHIVGVKEGKWHYITDGVEIYTAEEDVRYYSEPPQIRSERNGRKIFERNTESNRISRLYMTIEAFRNHCTKQGIEVRGQVTGSEKLRMAFGPAAIAGGVGALVGGPAGALIGAGIVGWFSSASDFEPEQLQDVFSRVREKYQKWVAFDEEKKAIEAKDAAEFETAARDNWRRYHRLRNLSSVDDLDGLEFEAAIGILYEKKGYRVRLTQASGDFGVDVIAEKGSEKLAIQAKRYSGTVGIKAVQEAASGAFYYKATQAIVVTNSFYTPKAKDLAEKLGVSLINRKRLALMWEQVHPDSAIPEFNLAQYKAIEREIRRELSHVDFSARKDKRTYYRR